MAATRHTIDELLEIYETCYDADEVIVNDDDDYDEVTRFLKYVDQMDKES